MAEFASHTVMTTVLVICGTVLLVTGVPFGQDLITLALGIELGTQEK